MSLPGKWEFPGGKIEPNETPESALVREIREELALDVKIGRFLGSGFAVSGERKVQLDIYAAEIIAGNLRLREHSAHRWLTADELWDLDWAEADIPVLPAVRDWLESLGRPDAP